MGIFRNNFIKKYIVFNKLLHINLLKIAFKIFKDYLIYNIYECRIRKSGRKATR